MENARVKPALKSAGVSADVFEKILCDFDEIVQNIDNIAEYMAGAPDSRTIYRQGDTMICPAYMVNFSAGREIYGPGEGWKEIVIRARGGLPCGTIDTDEINGPQARARVEKIIFSKYTREEYDEILTAAAVAYDKDKAQQHCFIADENIITVYENARYYDVNSAHGAGLLELFPRCAETWEKWYARRHAENGKYKKIMNYYWGALGMIGSAGGYRRTRGAYNWIVQRTTERVTELYQKLGTIAPYINTDGLIVDENAADVASSDRMGEFKRIDGTLYTYYQKRPGKSPYWLLQFDADDGRREIKGNCPLQLRGSIDLSKGETIAYQKKAVGNHYEYAEVETIGNIKKVPAGMERSNN